MFLVLTVLNIQQVFAQGACVNADFSAQNFNNWVGKYGTYNNPGQSVGIAVGRHTIMANPQIDPNTCGGLGVIPPGSTVSARLGNSQTGSQAEQLIYSMTVSQANALFVYKYAVVMEDPAHSVSEQPKFEIRILDQNGTQIGGNCGEYSVYAGQPGQNFQTCGSVKWMPWTTVGIDLTPYTGQAISIEFTTKDCNASGHYGYAYISASCYPLNITSTFCIGNNNAILTAPPGFQTYVWNPGNIYGQTLTVPNATVGSTYTVTMTSFSNQGNCTVNSSTTIAQTVVTADFSNTTACAGDPIQFTDLSTIQNGVNGSWIWSFGDGTSSNAQNPVHVYANSGTYTVTLTAYSASGCSGTITKQVTPNPKPVAGFTYPAICINDNVTFTNTTIDPLPTTYSWNLGSGFSSTQTNISNQFTVDGTYPIKLAVLNSNGCKDTVVHNVVVNPLPVVNAGIDFTTCPNMPITLNAAGALTYVWSNNVIDGQPYIPTVSNTYTVTGTDANGCVNTDQIFIQVFPVPVMDPGADQEACVGTTITLSASGVNAYQWTGGVMNGIGFVPPVGVHTYYVTGTDGNLCQLNDSVKVTIHAIPVVNAGLDRDICELSPAILTAQGANTYVWNNGVQNGVPFYPSTSNVYAVTGTDIHGCSSTDTVVVNVEPKVDVSFQVSDTFACAPFLVNFVNTTQSSNIIVGTVWNFGDGNSSLQNGPVSNTYNSHGCFDISLSLTTQLGCVWTATYFDTLCVYPTPIAAFQPSPATLTENIPYSVMMNSSIGGSTYIWNYGDGSASVVAEKPGHTFPTDMVGYYDIMLIAISDKGCIDTAYNKVYIKEELLYFIPNTFTPDNDNYNQIFTPVFVSGFDPYDFVMKIYNRWGELIFETHDAEMGWNGTYGNVEGTVPAGVYTWKIEYSNRTNGNREWATGHVNLLK